MSAVPTVVHKRARVVPPSCNASWCEVAVCDRLPFLTEPEIVVGREMWVIPVDSRVHHGPHNSMTIRMECNPRRISLDNIDRLGQLRMDVVVEPDLVDRMGRRLST